MKEFNYIFEVSRMVIFEVNYHSLYPDRHPYFATNAVKFVQNKRDYETCGQCQERVLTGKALEFFKKWDFLHLKDLKEQEYDLIQKDIEVLKETYNHYTHNAECFKGFTFYSKKSLSMQKMKGGK